MPSTKKLLQAAAGNAGGDPLYVEDVFSTYLWTGTGSSLAIANGIDLSGEGGLVWIKARNNARNHALYDTERGANLLASNTTAAQFGSPGMSANSDGFTVVDNSVNKVNETIASWTFRKAEKFFDVVTYTGNGTAGRTVAHNLGSVPAMMIVKCTTTPTGWLVYHSILGATKFLQLDTTNAETSGTYAWNDTAPTDSVFTVGSSPWANTNGHTYVAYLFASDAGGFGDDEDENIIKCGGYTADSSNAYPVTLGFEPQFVLIKKTSASGDWQMLDTMRGFTADAGGADFLYSNSSNAEASDSGAYLTSTGFVTSNQSASNGASYIYMAIRRPMKTPTVGTEVFQPIGTSGDNPNTTTATFPFDTQFNTFTDTNYATYNNQINDRLRGVGFIPSFSATPHLTTADTAAETTSSTFLSFKGNGMDVDKSTGWGAGSTTIFYNFKRAAGFMDVVARTGTGGSGVSVPHNLTVVPELVISKTRTASGFGTDLDKWFVWSSAISGSGNNTMVQLQSNSYNLNMGFFSPNSPTASAMTVHGNINYSGDELVYYLFATLAGISKVGSYTGTAADLNVDCGFTAGARFILIKRTDSTGDWYTYDSVRGITAGNDPYLLFNTTAAQVTGTNYVESLNAGFTVTSSAPAALNASSGTYIFLAIA